MHWSIEYIITTNHLQMNQVPALNNLGGVDMPLKE